MLTTKEIQAQLRELYDEAFSEDSAAFRAYFFDTLEERDCYTLIEDGKVNAMAYVVRKPCMIGGKRLDMPFIVALATRKMLKGQGRASKLMERLLSDLRNKGELFAALYPAIGHSYYTKFGFETVSFMRGQVVPQNAQSMVKVEKISKLDTNAYKRLEKINKKFFAKFDNHFIYDEPVIKRLTAEYASEDINLHIISRDGKDAAYCFADGNEKELNHVVGCYKSIDSVSEWKGYKYLIPSDAGEYCQIKAICADNGIITRLSKSKNFFIDKY